MASPRPGTDQAREWDDRRHRDGEVGSVVLADGEDVEAHLVGQARFVDDVEQSLLGRDAAAELRGDVAEGVETEFEGGHGPTW